MSNILLLCPKNDEESLQILKIAEAAKIPTVISEQPHGAQLADEPNLISRLKHADPGAKRVAIVEIPGPVIEDELRSVGYEVVIIDHHRYDGLDRMQHLSSLEQFLQVFGFDDNSLKGFGFEPLLVRGVGMIDRGFVWELKKEGLVPEDAKRVREYYRALMEELGGLSQEVWTEAQRAWDARETKGDVFVIRSQSKEFKIREALSFLMADLYEEPPQNLIFEGNGRITLQDSDAAPVLYKAFGGFTFGQDRCWGFAPTPGRPAPTEEAILAVIYADRH